MPVSLANLATSIKELVSKTGFKLTPVSSFCFTYNAVFSLNGCNTLVSVQTPVDWL